MAVIAGLPIVNAADYYVSPQGNDNNPGNIEAPFKTLKKAIESARAGTTIYLREGKYVPENNEIMREGAEGAYSCVYNLSAKGTAENPITITGYENENAVIGPVKCKSKRTHYRILCKSRLLAAKKIRHNRYTGYTNRTYAKHKRRFIRRKQLHNRACEHARRNGHRRICHTRFEQPGS